MSIIRDLYDIQDKELSRYRAKKSSRSRLLIEMQRNLVFPMLQLQPPWKTLSYATTSDAAGRDRDATAT
ncbi:MAG: hypothetical protein OQK74_08895, partial [Gammaproteobacteria bacterium]|nr:hypothetical protein [Gammaproteobacteria bacterium]